MELIHSQRHKTSTKHYTQCRPYRKMYISHINTHTIHDCDTMHTLTFGRTIVKFLRVFFFAFYRILEVLFCCPVSSYVDCAFAVIITVHPPTDFVTTRTINTLTRSTKELKFTDFMKANETNAPNMSCRQPSCI